ncbi:telomeric repeat-binding factor 1 isoform X2 [Pseudophryne corroboree]|uniref:telomeric repeat-binding factor 1 isoform X2 n=1 Tax=Pseudophryne corroboree TaxID=495146 RepID=UPI003081EEB7
MVTSAELNNRPWHHTPTPVLLDAMPTLSSENMNAVLIAQFLTRVAEGKHLDVHFETDEKLTPLETAATVLHELKEDEENLRSLQEEIETLVKIQAVAVCMEKGRFKLSSEVLERQFEESEANKYLRMKLSMVIGKKDPYHEFLENFSYTKMLKKIRSYISLKLASRPPVFLLQAAAKVVEAKAESQLDNRTEEHLSVKTSESTVEDLVTSEDTENEKSQQSQEAFDNDAQNEVQNSSSECENLTAQERSHLNHIEIGIANCTENKASITDKATESIEIGIANCTENKASITDKATERPQRRLFSLEQRTPWHPDKTKKRITRGTTINKRNQDNEKNKLHTSFGATKKKQPWTWEEDKLLKTGVKKYGVGQWRKILVHYKFNNRTGVMLKDRWRTMKKLNIVDDE